MIIGECPYDDCNGSMFNPIAEIVPSFQKLECKRCNRAVWLFHSRIMPVAYTEAEFHEEFEVDEENYSIKRRK